MLPDLTLLGKHIFPELSSTLGRFRLLIAMKILPKGTAHFLELILEKLACDLEKLSDAERERLVAYLKIDVDLNS